MADLTEEQKRFIVTELACFRQPTEVADLVKENFDLVITRQQVWHYRGDNPELAGPYKELFTQARVEFIKNVASLGTAHKAVRIRELEDMYHRAKRMGNYGLGKDLLEQIAKEQGDVYTNRRKVDINPQDALAELIGCAPEELQANEERK